MVGDAFGGVGDGCWPLALRLGERIPESDKVPVHMKCCQARVMVRHGLCLVIRSIDGPTGVCVYTVDVRESPATRRKMRSLTAASAQDSKAHCHKRRRQRQR